MQISGSDREEKEEMKKTDRNQCCGKQVANGRNRKKRIKVKRRNAGLGGRLRVSVGIEKCLNKNRAFSDVDEERIG